MIRRTIAAFLAAWLAAGQTVSALEPLASKPSAPKGERSPARSLPRFSPKPGLPNSALRGLPRIKPAAGLTAPVPAPRPEAAGPVSAFQNLTGLFAAEEPGQAARGEYDGQQPVQKPASDPILAASAPTNPEPALAKPAIERKSRSFKLAFTMGISAAIAAPVAYHAVPPLMTLYSGLFGALAMARLWGVQKIWSWAARRFSGPRGSKDGEPARAKSAAQGRILSIGAGLLLGLTQGSTPVLFSREIVALAARVAAPQRQIRALGPAFSQEVIAALSQNPEGREVLDGLRDRGGTIRLPNFYLGDIGDPGGFTFPPLNAIFLSNGVTADKPWAASDFVRNPDKRRRFVQDNDSLIFHELFHALQFRKVLQPGQLERFPRQLLGYFTYELEYEAFLRDRLFVHAKLKADPLAPIPDYDFNNYRDFIGDADHYLDGMLDKSYSGAYLVTPRLPLYRHVESRYYRAAFAKLKERWPALSVEGCLLVARRYEAWGQPAMSWEYQQMAARRAKEHGLPAPDLSSFKYRNVRPRHAPSGNIY